MMKAAVAALAVGLLFGCSAEQARKVEYKRATTLKPLEVPPDLSAPELQGNMPIPEGDGVQSLSAYNQENAGGSGGQQVLPAQQNARVEQDGTQRWLVVKATPEQLWGKLRAFWQQQGLELKRDEPTIGIMETQWAENLADVPQDFITNAISRVFKSAHSAGTRDKYRVRLERGSEPGTTEIYLTQYGLKEVVRSTNEGFNDTIWEQRPSDPELVNEMLNRLLVYLGMSQKQAAAVVARPEQTAVRAHLAKDSAGQPALIVDEEFARAWRRVGIALDRIGLVVADRDRTKGIYFVHQGDVTAGAEKKGLFSGMFFGGDAKAAGAVSYRVVVQDNGDSCSVTIQGADGQVDVSAKAQAFLTQLETELR